MLYAHLRWKRPIRDGYEMRIFEDRVGIAWGKPTMSVPFARITGNGPDGRLGLRDERIVRCPKPPGFEGIYDALEAGLARRRGRRGDG